jgi:MoaA/NifB/PqqE/SkfB family radical SAM enzyme
MNDISEIYSHIKSLKGARTVSVTLMRNAGVARIEGMCREKLGRAYEAVIRRREHDMASNELDGYSAAGTMGRVSNRLSRISARCILKTFLTDDYIVPCMAGRLLGVIKTDGTVSCCEVLSEPMGKLADFDYDLEKLWRGGSAIAVRKKIASSRCHCTYECAWVCNILGSKWQSLKLLPALWGA